jgi:hypothetical protein
MLNVFMRQEVRIFRARNMTSADGPEFVEVSDGAAPLPLFVKLEEITARPVTKDGAEQTVDGTLLFEVKALPEVRLQDLVVPVDKVTKKGDGRVFRIARLEINRNLGSVRRFAKAGLTRISTKVPEVKPSGE